MFFFSVTKRILKTHLIHAVRYIVRTNALLQLRIILPVGTN